MMSSSTSNAIEEEGELEVQFVVSGRKDGEDSRSRKGEGDGLVGDG